MRTYLITGAQGFVGRFLIGHLLASDAHASIVGVGRSLRNDLYFTHAIHRGADPVPAPVPAELILATGHPRYGYISLDLCRTDALVSVLKEFAPTVVFHLASALRGDAVARLFQSNLEATFSLFDALGRAACPVECVVVASSGAVYGNPTALPIHEDAPCQPVDVYGVSKLSAEHTARILGAEREIVTVVARLFNLVGPGQDERHVCGRFASSVAAIAAGHLPPVLEVGNLETTRDFIDVRDVARALHLLSGCASPGEIYNVANGTQIWIRAILDILLRLAGINDAQVLEGHESRRADIACHFADVGALHRLGFASQYALGRSLADLLEYYIGLDGCSRRRRGTDLHHPTRERAS